MYLIANSRITIGSLKFNNTVNNVTAETSVKELEGKATITLPRAFVAKAGKNVIDLIKREDKVTIELGYNGNYNIEFEGYVDVIGSETPLVIECDNLWMKHKKNSISKSWAKVDLKEVLTTALPGYKIDCPEVNLGKFIIKSASTFETVKGLMRSVGFYTRIDESTKTVKCYWPYDINEFNTHTYVFGSHNEAELQKRKLWPNVRKSYLTYKVKDDIKVRIIAKSITKAGKKLKVEVGSDDKNADKRTRNYGHEIENETQLKEAAERDLKRWTYGGYRGNIKGFGSPQTMAGDTLKLIDVDHTDRESSYLIDKVRITYDSESATFERDNSLSYKVS